ncbi:MAG: Na+/H+ antiporter subunit E [Verrucomicrobiales bacterium]|nr:Na+/H+ antiporter subunit E [Verrucomicrobiota bacterium JB025]
MNLPSKLAGWARFSGFYLTEVIKSNLQIAWDVLTPTDHTRQGLIRLDLPAGLGDGRILLISNLITMTPGTLSLELSEDRRTLLLHILYLEECVENTRNHLQQNYVERVLQLG